MKLLARSGSRGGLYFVICLDAGLPGDCGMFGIHTSTHQRIVASTHQRMSASHIKPEIDDIPVLYFIGLPLELEMPLLTCCMRTAGGDKIIIGNDLCPYKTPLDI